MEANKPIEKSALSEAEELMAGINRDILALEKASREGRESAPVVNDLFRRAHSFKSLSNAIGQVELAKLAHEFETVLEAMRFGKIQTNTEVLDALFSCVDGFHHLLAFQGSEREKAVKETEAILAALAKLAAKAESTSNAPVSIVDIGPEMLSMLTQYEEHRLREVLLRGKKLFIVRVSFSLNDFDLGLASVEAVGEQLGEIICKLPSDDDGDMEKIGFDLVFAADFEVEELEQAFSGEDVLLIPVNNDSIVWHDGALPESADEDDESEDDSTNPFVATGSKPEKRDTQSHETEVAEAMPRSLKQLTQTVRVDVEEIEGFLRSTADAIVEVEKLIAAAPDNAENLEGISTLKEKLVAMEDKLYRFRRLPLNDLFERMVRLGRKTARELGKQVRFEVEGAHLLVDAALVEVLGEPILHLIRNAIDHGIEDVDVRLQKNKLAEACIRLIAREDEKSLSITVIDDGAGIAEDEARRVAQERGLLSAESAGEVSHEQLLEWLLLPGFTTKAEASTVSGRGVGMDAVQTCIAEFDGEITLHSQVDQGVEISLRFPLERDSA